MDVILWYSSQYSSEHYCYCCYVRYLLSHLQMETLSYAEFIKLSFGNIRKYEYTYVSVGEEVYQLWEIEVRRKDNIQLSFLSYEMPRRFIPFFFSNAGVNLVGRFPLLDSSVFAPFQSGKIMSARQVETYANIYMKSILLPIDQCNFNIILSFVKCIKKDVAKVAL